MNVVGVHDALAGDGSVADMFKQGGLISRALNVVPGVNAIGGMDDFLLNAANIFVAPGVGDAAWPKLISIPASVGLGLPALMDRIPVQRPLEPFGKR